MTALSAYLILKLVYVVKRGHSLFLILLIAKAWRSFKMLISVQGW